MTRRSPISLKQRVSFDRAGFHLFFRGVQIYDPARPLYDYIAFKLGPNPRLGPFRSVLLSLPSDVSPFRTLLIPYPRTRARRISFCRFRVLKLI